MATGCLDASQRIVTNDGTGSDPTGTPGTEDHRRACVAGETGQGQYYSTVHTDDEIWDMSASPDPVALNDEVTFRMENVSGATVGTWGSSSMTAIQFRDGGEWTEITYFHDVAWGDGEAYHAPGDGWEWTADVSRGSLADLGKFAICADLVPGSYRFLYWGISRDEREFEHAIGTEFEVTRR